MLIVVVAFTSLFAFVNALVILMTPDGATLWNVSRLLVSVFILGVGMLTWRQVCTHTRALTGHG